MLLLVVSVSVGTIPCVNISFVVSICVYMVVVFLSFFEWSFLWCGVRLCDLTYSVMWCPFVCDPSVLAWCGVRLCVLPIAFMWCPFVCDPTAWCGVCLCVILCGVHLVWLADPIPSLVSLVSIYSTFRDC